MLRLLPYYFISSLIVLSFLYFARASDNEILPGTFFIPLSESSSKAEIINNAEQDSDSPVDNPLQYKEGDWYKYVIEPSYKKKVMSWKNLIFTGRVM